jgi:hypothetical protein
LNDTTDPDTAASLDAAAVRIFGLGAVLIHPEAEAIVAAGMARPGAVLMPWTDVLRLPKVWTDGPCPHHSRMMPNRHCRRCDGTERILEPASS